jgi:hypothetical protein
MQENRIDDYAICYMKLIHALSLNQDKSLRVKMVYFKVYKVLQI